MGLMKSGQWLSSDEARAQKKFVREQALFRNWIAPDGAFPPAPDRYHLYVSLACPWASRAVIVRKLKKLEAVLPMTVVHPDMLEKRLAKRRFLFGDRMTLADVRLFTTAVRFDAVYYSHFKCNLRHLWDYRNVWRWVCEMYQTNGIAQTVDLAQIKRHYYHSQHCVNPSGVVPVGPPVDFVSERATAAAQASN